MAEFNIVELASDLASSALKRECEEVVIEIFEEDSEGNTYYTEKAQGIFDNYYDYYYTQLEKIKKENV